MKVSIQPTYVTLWASARDTYEWAHRPRKSWPCSQLSGRRFVAGFDSNGLVELVIDGGRGEQDVDANELTAICSDLLERRLPQTHPAYDTAVR